MALVVKNPPANAGDVSFLKGFRSERSNIQRNNEFSFSELIKEVCRVSSRKA